MRVGAQRERFSRPAFQEQLSWKARRALFRR